MPKRVPVNPPVPGFGARVRWLRTKRRWSCQRLADELGVYGANVSDWENGRRMPVASTLIRLAQEFGVSADVLLGLVRDVRLPGPWNTDAVLGPCPECGGTLVETTIKNDLSEHFQCYSCGRLWYGEALQLGEAS